MFVCGYECVYGEVIIHWDIGCEVRSQTVVDG
jgi:hypothetical protein